MFLRLSFRRHDFPLIGGRYVQHCMFPGAHVLKTLAVGHVHRRREPNVKDRREVVFMLMARNP